MWELHGIFPLGMKRPEQQSNGLYPFRQDALTTIKYEGDV